MTFCLSLSVLDEVEPLICPIVTDFMCHDGHCVESRLRCDHKGDCADGSDEADCGEQEQEAALMSELTPKRDTKPASLFCLHRLGLRPAGRLRFQHG